MRLIGKIFVGILAVLGGFVALVVVIGALALSQIETSALGVKPVPEKGFLSLKLNAELAEKTAELSFLDEDGNALDLRKTVEAIDRAASDPRILGLVARISPSDRSLAQTQELRDAVLRFRKSGKPSIAFATSLDQGGKTITDVYLSSAFEEFWLQPSGGIDFSGYAYEIPFFRKALEDIGLSAEHAARAEYKNAFDSVVRDTMSDAQREAMLKILETARHTVVDDIAQGRKLSYATVNALPDHLPMLAQEAKDVGLVTRLAYWDEVLSYLKERGGVDTLVKISDYAAEEVPAAKNAMKIAYIQAVGDIEDGESERQLFSEDGDIGGDTLARAIREAANDPSISAIVLRVNSPGGSYVASDTIWREVKRAREKNMPVIVSMGDIAASGGYFMALPATRIIAQPGTFTGSIGVLSMKLVAQELWKKLDVNWETVSVGKHASLWSGLRPFTEEERAWFNRLLDTIYADFTSKVAQGRNLPIEQVEKAARGRVWLGEDALKLGLVDELGGFPAAFAAAKKAAGRPEETPHVLVSFPKPESEFERFIAAFRGEDVSEAVKTFVRTMRAVETIAGPALRSVEGAAKTSAAPATLYAPDLSR